MAAVVAAMLFYCPTCQSAPNEPCYESGYEVKIHVERTHKAAREMRARRQAGADLFAPEPERDWNADWADYKDQYAQREAAEERAAYQAEYDAETAYERHLETNDQYRWEVDEDERRAAAFGGYDYGTGGHEYYV